MTVYDVGEPVILTSQFYSDQAQTILADPASVVLTIRNPAGVVTTPTVLHPSTGVYTALWTPALRGQHEVRWDGEGTIAAVSQYGINVRGGFPSTSDLVDVQTVRSLMRMPKSEDDQDPILELLISSASAHIIDAYQHEFAPAASVPETRVFGYRANGVLDFAPFNAQVGTVSDVTLDSDSASTSSLAQYTDWFSQPVTSRWGVIDYLRTPTLYPYPRYTRGDISHQLWRSVSVTATWGYPVVPDPVRMACAWTVIHWHRKYVGLRPSAFQEVDDTSATPGEVAIPPMARWLMRGFENRSLFA